MTASISTNQSQAFNRDGYVALQAFTSPPELLELESNLHRFIETIVPTMPAEKVFFESKHDAASLKQIQQMGEHDAYFHDLLHDSPIRQAAEALLNDQVVPQNLQYFNKPPQLGQPTPAHQDGFYFMLEPCEAITFWLALDVTDESNGCVRYVRGSHRQGIRQHRRTTTLGFSQGIADFGAADISGETAVLAKPGDLLAHHAMTIHRADGNQSTDRQRRALGLIYYAERARQDEQAFERYQQQLARDMTEAGAI